MSFWTDQSLMIGFCRVWCSKFYFFYTTWCNKVFELRFSMNCSVIGSFWFHVLMMRHCWHFTVQNEMKAMQHSWGSLTRLAQDRHRWRNFVAALHTTGCNGWWWWWWLMALISQLSCKRMTDQIKLCLAVLWEGSLSFPSILLHSLGL